MRKYLLPVSAFFLILISCFAIYIILKQPTQIENSPNIDSNNTDLTLTKNEATAIDKWRLESMYDLTKDAYTGDSAGLWMLGMSFLTGAANFPLNTEYANRLFSWSASLGFGPSLDQLRRMYAFDVQNSFLALVYLNLTISAGHRELLGLYQKIRSQLIEDGGLKVVNEIEKIALHKKEKILHLTSRVKNGSNDFLKIILREGAITDDDVLFDMKFWEDIITGRLATGNLEGWLKDSKNYCLKIERLAQKEHA